ncbi:MAG: DUF2284 domain-containing protein [Desulfarculaceae bacterium]|nr:DUF2284 domain-containing protein [Desulfarculaceae bacterium]MCF8071944.1 DUF2284 domain-containing protein [Desulfarculaceae bacterium]MCF8101461.1 DUF2284 domain-containing protein [Desulfarculaceae bacterium]MCF8115011.1 DUF2284 domain-containing protein [Desulfarculaceae bacterium]
MQKYIDLSLELGAARAKLLGPEQVFLDPRARLKCRWGCHDYLTHGVRCGDRGIGLAEFQQMLSRYSNILLMGGPDARKMSQAVLGVEAAAFRDGHTFAFGIRTCNLCKVCAVDQGKECVSPEKVRPCDQALGIDVFRTVREAGMPIQVLKDKDEPQNRYGFVLIN